MVVLYVYCFKSVGSYKHKLSRIESLVILYWGINCTCWTETNTSLFGLQRQRQQTSITRMTIILPKKIAFKVYLLVSKFNHRPFETTAAKKEILGNIFFPETTEQHLRRDTDITAHCRANTFSYKAAIYSYKK